MSFEAPCKDNLLKIATAYAKAERVPLSTVGRRCYGNVNFFKLLRRGAVTIRKIEEVLQWFRDNWPERADWPFVAPVFMSRSDEK